MQMVALGSLDLAVMDAPALGGSPERFAQLGPGEDTSVLDAALCRIFPGARPERPEAVALEILRYVPAVTRLENVLYPRGSDVLVNGKGNCMSMALAFVALCQRAGFPARVNAFHNVSVMQAHNAAEIHYENGWHFFDPTYGAFFKGPEAPDGVGGVAGLRALLARPELRANGFMVLAPEALWKGARVEAGAVVPLAREFKYGQYAFTLGELYEGLFARAFPVVESPEQTAIYPLDLDLRAADSVEIGAVNGDMLDVLGKAADGIYPRFRGYPVIGPTPVGGASLLVTFQTRGPGKYLLTLHLAPGSTPSAPLVTEIKDVHVLAPALDGGKWRVEVSVQSESGQMLLSSPGKPVYLDAIAAERP